MEPWRPGFQTWPKEPIRCSQGSSCVLLWFFCQIFSFAKFTFGLAPELYIRSYRPVLNVAA
jgi:hypothetical protein